MFLQNKSPFELNVAACRVVLDILPGLQKEVLESTDGLVKRLYGWAKSSEEPLQSYATGLLGAALELQGVATDPENREQNTSLVPAIVKRLRDYKQEAEEENKKTQAAFKRPFSMFCSSNGPGSPTKSPSRRLSYEEDHNRESLFPAFFKIILVEMPFPAFLNYEITLCFLI